MDYERHLVSKIIADRSMTEVSEAAIKTDFFLDANSRSVFDAILRHKSQYGNVPSLAAIKASFPTYKFVQPTESFGYYIDAVRKQHTLALLERGLGAGVEALDKRDPKATMTAMSAALAEVARDVPNTRDIDITKTGVERMKEYLALKNLDGGLRGIPTGFAALDKATLGFQAGQLVTMVGFAGAGKSTMMLLAALAAHQHGKRVAFFTFEMSNEEQVERLDAIRAGISHEHLRSGKLTRSEEEKLERWLTSLDDLPPFFFSSDTMATTTLTGVQGKIDTLKPEIVLVDGVYLMEDEQGEPQRSAQAIAHLTTGFKRMAQNNEIPILLSTQALAWKTSKKAGLTGDAIGYSTAPLQDSDVVVGVEKTDDPAINRVRMLKARNAANMEVYISWDWTTGQFTELDAPPLADDVGDWGV